MIRLDDYLCARAQRATDWVQDWTGLTCFRQADLLVIAQASIELPSLRHRHAHWFDLAGCLVVLGVLLFAGYLGERSCARSPAAMNYIRYAGRTTRITWVGVALALALVLICIPNLELLVSTVDMLLLSLWSYVVACTPRPRRTSKVRRSIKRLARIRLPRLSALPSHG